jgi:hypothetical protein
MSDIVDALQDIEQAVERVEQAVKNNNLSSFVTPSIWGLVMIFLVFPWFGKVWYGKWRYAVQYSIDASKVQINSQPHDCDFLTAPLGEKNCHYERSVSTVRWATSTLGQPIISLDEGKTWTTFTPDANVKVPNSSTIETIYVLWEKGRTDLHSTNSLASV